MGSLNPPIGLKNVQNSTFLVLLRPISAPKMKTAPLKGFGSRSCEELAVVWTKIVDYFGSGAHSKAVKTFFYWRSPAFGRKKPLSFWFRPEKPFEFRWRPFVLEITYIRPGKNLEFRISAGKTLWISVKTFFSFSFGDHLFLTEKPPQSNLRLKKIWVKFVFGCIKLPKKPLLPLCEILVTRLQSTIKYYVHNVFTLFW